MYFIRFSKTFEQYETDFASDGVLWAKLCCSESQNLTMQKFLDTLGLQTNRECSRKGWICFVILFLIMGVNFSRLIMPLWILLIIIFAIVFYSIFGLIGSAYYLLVGWGEFTYNTRTRKVLYWLLLTLLTVLDVCILVAFSRGI